MNEVAQGNTAFSLPARLQIDTRHDMVNGLEGAICAVPDALGLGVVLVNDALVVRYANRAVGQWLGDAGQPACNGLAAARDGRNRRRADRQQSAT